MAYTNETYDSTGKLISSKEIPEPDPDGNSDGKDTLRLLKVLRRKGVITAAEFREIKNTL